MFVGVGAFGLVGIGVARRQRCRSRSLVGARVADLLAGGHRRAFRLAKPHSLWARLFYRTSAKARAPRAFPDAGAASGRPDADASR